MIRANIYAQTSYALNRVFTEVVPRAGAMISTSQIPRATISPFVPGRDIFENISTIVDDMFNNYLTRGEAIEPLFAQNCNGTTTTCRARLSQWGTVRSPSRGMSAEEIKCVPFTGTTSNFVHQHPSPPNPAARPGVTFRLGDVSRRSASSEPGSAISTNYPNIPKIYPVDGILTRTPSAPCARSSSRFNLAVDRIVGKSTYRIAFIYNNVKRLSELDSEGLRLEDVSASVSTELREGATVQCSFAFSGRGGIFRPAPRWQINQLDGVFGPRREAVTAYQRRWACWTGAVDRTTERAASTYQSILAARPLSRE